MRPSGRGDHPSVLRALGPAPGRPFPLRFGGHVLARPRGVGRYVVPGDVHDRMLYKPSSELSGPGDGASRHRGRSSTTGSDRPGRPAGRAGEDHRRGHEELRPCARVVVGIRRCLGEGHVSGGVDERRPLLVRDRTASIQKPSMGLGGRAPPPGEWWSDPIVYSPPGTHTMPGGPSDGPAISSASSIGPAPRVMGLGVRSGWRPRVRRRAPWPRPAGSATRDEAVRAGPGPPRPRRRHGSR